MASTLTLRKNVDGMTADELAATRDAYAKMQALADTDSRSWYAYAGEHGFPRGMCWHHSKIFNGVRSYPYNLFLPWHRAYLISFEHAMRDLNADATLPWWDWTTGAVPGAFSDAQAGGQPNSLASAPAPAIPKIREAGVTQRFPGQGVSWSLPSPGDVESALALSSFTDFSGQVENLHDNVHGWTGGSQGDQVGDMSQVPGAAFDPIFWSHHCMIDRIWYLWQLQHGLNNIPQDYLGRPLAPFNLRVEDVLDIHVLGYEYATSSIVAAAGPTKKGGAAPPPAKPAPGSHHQPHASCCD